jgi:hypothetical protein
MFAGCWTAGLVLAAAGPARGQDAAGALAVLAARAEAPPVLDGRLDDPVWAAAVAVTNFTQVLPNEGDAPSERTEVRFAFDARHLYVGIRCFDREPDRIVARELQRDAFGDDARPFPTDDQVTLVLDPFRRGREGFLFGVNPLGAQADGRIENVSRTRPEWDGLWDARATRDEHGWTAELVIPFSTLSFDPRGEAWGVNVERVIRRRDETVRWATPLRSRETDSVAGIAQLRGLAGLEQGRGFEFRPYAAVTYRSEAEGEHGWEFRPGFDASYLITPALTATVTVNTDFAEADVDARVVNLTRFPVFFPEKREFFLRDAPYFAFGGIDYNPYPLFTRTIGLSADGKPVDILAGAKLTGRLGGTTIGVLNVQQEAYDDVPSRNLTVARVATEVLGESSAGLLLTHGDPFTAGDNTLLGADFNFLTTRLAGERSLESHAWIMGTDSDRAGGQDYALGANVYWPNLPWDLYTYFGQVGEDFDPGLGFVERAGIREYIGDYAYRWQLNARWAQRLDFVVAPYFVTDLDNVIETEDHALPRLRWVGPAGDILAATLRFRREQFEEPFEIWPDVTIPGGDYRFPSYRAEFEGASSRAVVPLAAFEAGDFYDGHFRAYELGADWRPSRHVLLGASGEMNEIRLPHGSFNTRLASARLNLALNPRVSWNTLVQYDNASDTFGLNTRVRWTLRPGTDFYLVFNQGWAVDPGTRLRSLNSDATLKGTLTWRF